MSQKVSWIVIGATAWAILASSPVALAQAPTPPELVASEATIEITNPWYRMPVGRRLSYRERTEDGVETTDIWVTGETRMINGILCTVVFDRVYLDGELIEETKDYIVQNKATGDVWYYGEAVDNFKNGRFKDHDGSWIAGENGAEPGIWMPGDPKVGLEFRMEYLKGVAEDMGRVEATLTEVKSGGKTYKDCVQVREHTPLEPNAKEDKYYCRDIGAQVLLIDRETGTRSELQAIRGPH